MSKIIKFGNEANAKMINGLASQQMLLKTTWDTKVEMQLFRKWE